MSLADLPSLAMVHVPSLESACQLLSERHASSMPTILLAGGTDWMVEMGSQRVVADNESLPLVVDISRMPALREITCAGNVLRVGAATTYLEMRRSPIVLERAPLLARMAADIGAVQIQARGTLGGNLATGSPAADGVAALAAYDATIVVASVRGERRIPFADLQTGYKTTTRAPDEIIVAIELGLTERGAPWCWRKVGTRLAQAISKVALASVAEISGGRLIRFGLGMASVAPVTATMSNTRALGVSRPLAQITCEAIDAAVDQDISPIDDVRSTREYRAHVARAVTRAWFRELGAAV